MKHKQEVWKVLSLKVHDADIRVSFQIQIL